MKIDCMNLTHILYLIVYLKCLYILSDMYRHFFLKKVSVSFLPSTTIIFCHSVHGDSERRKIL